MTIADATTYHLRNSVRRHLKAMSATLVNAGMPDDIAEQLSAKIHNIVWGVYSTYGPGSIGAEVTALADAQEKLHDFAPDEKVSPP